MVGASAARWLRRFVWFLPDFWRPSEHLEFESTPLDFSVTNAFHVSQRNWPRDSIKFADRLLITFSKKQLNPSLLESMCQVRWLVDSSVQLIYSLRLLHVLLIAQTQVVNVSNPLLSWSFQLIFELMCFHSQRILQETLTAQAQVAIIFSPVVMWSVKFAGLVDHSVGVSIDLFITSSPRAAHCSNSNHKEVKSIAQLIFEPMFSHSQHVLQGTLTAQTQVAIIFSPMVMWSFQLEPLLKVGIP